MTRLLHLSGAFDTGRLAGFVRARAALLGLSLEMAPAEGGLRVALSGPAGLLDMAEIALCLGPGAALVEVRREDGTDPGTPAVTA